MIMYDIGSDCKVASLGMSKHTGRATMQRITKHMYVGPDWMVTETLEARRQK